VCNIVYTASRVHNTVLILLEVLVICILLQTQCECQSVSVLRVSTREYKKILLNLMFFHKINIKI